jgi:hypothetical protein
MAAGRLHPRAPVGGPGHHLRLCGGHAGLHPVLGIRHHPRDLPGQTSAAWREVRDHVILPILVLIVPTLIATTW